MFSIASRLGDPPTTDACELVKHINALKLKVCAKEPSTSYHKISDIDQVLCNKELSTPTQIRRVPVKKAPTGACPSDAIIIDDEVGVYGTPESMPRPLPKKFKQPPAANTPISIPRSLATKSRKPPAAGIRALDFGRISSTTPTLPIPAKTAPKPRPAPLVVNKINDSPVQCSLGKKPVPNTRSPCPRPAPPTAEKIAHKTRTSRETAKQVPLYEEIDSDQDLSQVYRESTIASTRKRRRIQYAKVLDAKDNLDINSDDETWQYEGEGIEDDDKLNERYEASFPSLTSSRAVKKK